MPTTTQSITDYGPKPYAVHLHNAAVRNTNYRVALWTGSNVQLTIMSINPGEDIGLEAHEENDQIIRIEEGTGLVQMGETQNNLHYTANVREGDVVVVPMHTWHNLTNTGLMPLKLSSVYGPPDHPHGDVQTTRPAQY